MTRLAYPLFLLTGAAGLVYQTVWMRMMIRVFGVTVYATATVVAVFMLGLAIGALVGGRVAAKGSSLRQWGFVEAAAGVVALFATLAINALPELWAVMPVAASGATTLVRLGLATLCLLPPTALMGATLPLLVGALDLGHRGRTVSLLYGLNTLGAVVGVVGVGFIGLATLGEFRTVASAVVLQTVVGAVAALSRPATAAAGDAPAPSTVETADSNLRPALILIAAAVAGSCMLACELAWTRLLIFLVGGSVYGFSSTLAMVLTGIALGSFVAPRLSPRSVPLLFAALGVLSATSLRAFLILGLAASGPEYLYSPLQRPSDALRFFVAAALVVLPTTFVSGALFPLLVRCAHAASGRRAADVVGRVYFINTIGAVVGSIGAGFVLIPTLGAQGTVFFTAVVFLAVAAVMGLATGGLRHARGVVVAALSAAGLALVLPSGDVTRDVLDQRLLLGAKSKVLSHVDTVDATVSLSSLAGEPVLFLNGILTSGKGPVGELMAHIPLLLQDNPERALVICLGAGSTFTAASQHVPRVDLVELVGEVVESYPTFHPDTAGLLKRPGNRVFVDDGRNFLLRSSEKWDAIVIDGAPPIHSAGFVNLYSQEMAALTRAHLTEDGVLLMWLPMPSFPEDIWAMVRAVTLEYPHTAMFTADMSGFMLLASQKPLLITPERIDAHVAARSGRVPDWLNAEMLFSEGRFIDDATVRARAGETEPLTDDRPQTEFPLMRLLRGERMVERRTDLFP